MIEKKILFQVSTGELFADLQRNAGISSSLPSEKQSILMKAFEPEKDISAYELAQVFILFKNLSKDGRMLTDGEFDALPTDVARHFKDA